jgi:hypothetical protein
MWLNAQFFLPDAPRRVLKNPDERAMLRRDLKGVTAFSRVLLLYTRQRLILSVARAKA